METTSKPLFDHHLPTTTTSNGSNTNISSTPSPEQLTAPPQVAFKSTTPLPTIVSHPENTTSVDDEVDDLDDVNIDESLQVDHAANAKAAANAILEPPTTDPVSIPSKPPPTSSSLITNDDNTEEPPPAATSTSSSSTSSSNSAASSYASDVEFHNRLFENLDTQITDETTQICLACSTIFERSFPKCDKLPCPAIPVHILQSFWREIVGDSVNPAEVLKSLDFFITQSVVYLGHEVECVQVTHQIYQEYGHYIFNKIVTRLGRFGTSMEEIVSKWNDILVKLLDYNSSTEVFKIYATLLLPSHTRHVSTQNAINLLTSREFVTQRISLLGIPNTTAIYIIDCESLPLSLPISYNTFSSELSTLPIIDPETRVQIARALLNLANSLRQSTSHPSLSLYFGALTQFESVLNHKCTAGISPISAPLLEVSQMDMAETLHHLGVLSGQMSYHDRELSIRRRLLGKHHPSIAGALHCIGTLHASKGEWEEALVHFQEALRIRRLAARDVSSNRDMEMKIAETLECEGDVLAKMGNYEKAKDSLKEALMLRGLYMKSDCVEVAALHHKLGLVEEEMEHYAASLAQFGEALRIRRNCARDGSGGEEEGGERVAETLCCMARVYQERGESGYAVECYREAVIKKKAYVMKKVKWMREWYERENARILPMPFFHGGKKKKWTISLNMVDEDTWGDVNEEDKKEVAALLRIMVNIVDLSIKQHGKDNLFISTAFQSMGEVYLKIGFYNKAIRCLDEACQIRTSLGLDDDIMAIATHQLGICHAKLGRHEMAIEKLQQSLDVWYKNAPKKDPSQPRKEIADLWYDIGNAQSAMGSNDALQSLNNALKIRQALSPPNEIEILHVRYCLGVAHTHLSNYGEARDIFEEIVEFQKNYFGEDHLYVAHTLYYLGQVYQASSLQNPSVELLKLTQKRFERALEIYRKHLKDSDIVVAHVHHSLGTVSNIMEDYIKAKKHFELALKTYKLYNGGENLLVASILNHMGVIFTLDEEDFKSMMCLQEALRIRTKLLGNNHSTVADTLHNIGGVHAKFDRYREAMTCYERVLIIRIECHGEDDLSVAKVLNNLGIIHARIGEYKMARNRLKRALRIEHLWEEESESIASSLYNLGNVLAYTRKYDAAVHCYEESLNIRRNLHGDNHPAIANMMHNLGRLCEEKADYEASKKWYDDSLRVKRLLLGPDSLSLAMTLSKVGDLQVAEDDYDGAVTCYQKVLRVQKRQYGPDHVDVARTFMLLGNVKKLLNELDYASMCVEEALRIREETHGELHQDVASSLYMLGSINDIMGEQEDAFLCYGNAYRIYRIKGGRNDRDRKQVIRALRKIITKMHGSAGFCDTLVITGDCWLGIEGIIMDFVKYVKLYVTMPTTMMVQDIVNNTSVVESQTTDTAAAAAASGGGQGTMNDGMMVKKTENDGSNGKFANTSLEDNSLGYSKSSDIRSSNFVEGYEMA